MREEARSSSRTIWVDADASPREVKDIVFRAGRRLGLEVVLVANQRIAVPAAYPSVKVVGVSGRADAADRYIEAHAKERDIVVTADIALAAALVARPVTVIDPRGTEYTQDNAGAALSARNFMEGLRGAGMKTAGPRPYGPRDAKAFAATLDRALARGGRS